MDSEVSTLGLRLAENQDPGNDDLGGSGNDVGHLEANARPCAPSLAAAMDADDPAADGDLADDLIPFELGTVKEWV